MKLIYILFFLLLILVFALTGCVPARPTIQPTQVMLLSSPTISSATVAAIPTSTLTPVILKTETLIPTVTVRLPTATLASTVTPMLVDTLEPEIAKATIESFLHEPMNCDVPCFWGIIPGKTSRNEARTLFGILGFTTREGGNFYSTAYNSDNGNGFSAIFNTYENIIKNVEITPYITEQTEGSPREWIAYSPETLIKKFGNPSRVQFAIDNGPNYVIGMTMYFDDYDLIADYSGYNMFPDRPHSPRLCPLTAPFDHVRLWMGPSPQDPPSFETVALEKATSLTMDQFIQLMLGDPQKACFTLNGDMFQ
jgi:hypothetical protein